MEREIQIKENLEAYSLYLSEKLGQHFLIDEKVIDLLASSILPEAKVIEVGSGIGHVTEALAQRARQVVGIEIDRRFQPILEEMCNRYPNIKFVIKDALQISFGSLVDSDGETQIIANLPFHITEPFLCKLIDLPVANAVLVLGDNTARELQESEKGSGFGKISLLSQAFFDTRVLAQVPREAFYPQPRTDAVVVEFNPRDRRKIETNPANYVFAYLFRKAGKYGLVVNDMKQALIEVSQKGSGSDLSKRESHRRDRSNAKRGLRQMLGEYNGSGDFSVFQNHNRERGEAIISQSQALDVIRRMGIPETVLNKPFFRLDNQDVRDLAAAVREFYSR